VSLVTRKALSTLATIVAEFGDYSRHCEQGLKRHSCCAQNYALGLPTPDLSVISNSRPVTFTFGSYCCRKLQDHAETHLCQNPLDTFPHNFPVNGRVVNLLATSRCNGIWETDMTQIARANFVTDLSFMLPHCCALATGKLV